MENIIFFDCKECSHNKVCKHCDIDVQEFKDHLMTCLDNFSYNTDFIEIKVKCKNYQGYNIIQRG